MVWLGVCDPDTYESTFYCCSSHLSLIYNPIIPSNLKVLGDITRTERDQVDKCDVLPMRNRERRVT